MQSELTERTERLIDRELRTRNPIVRSHAIMKMCSTDRLRDEQQRRAENRDRARGCRAAPMNPGYHLILPAGRRDSISFIEPAA